MRQIALTPPMGWNSWDCYGASVTESEVRGNAEYMAAHLLQFGWEYIVVDIQWYEPGARSSAYNHFAPLEMDEYSRLMPAQNRFPSAKGGAGFRPLADYIHGLGLKFGIHVMRGIPRQAVHGNARILGTSCSARDIAHPASICLWNTDMYGVEPSAYCAQAYYDSLFALYASWGVDYLKVDDIASPYNAGEIELIHRSIVNCGREIVLSLSPGPAPIERAEHLKRYANLWRTTGDFWDRFEDLACAFDKCSVWSGLSGPGGWADADMLPIGHIGIRSCEHGVGERWTRFTKEEQVSLITLWCMARSPLMLGCELRDLDEWTLSLITNPEVLRIVTHSHSGRQLYRSGRYGQYIAWTAKDEDGAVYLALFNMGNIPFVMEAGIDSIGLQGMHRVRELWKRSNVESTDCSVAAEVPPHGAMLFRLEKYQNGFESRN